MQIIITKFKSFISVIYKHSVELGKDSITFILKILPQLTKVLAEVISRIYDMMENSLKICKVLLIELVDLYLIILSKLSFIPMIKTLSLLMFVCRLAILPGVSGYISPEFVMFSGGLVDFSLSCADVFSFVLSDFKMFVIDAMGYKSESDRLRLNLSDIMNDMKDAEQSYLQTLREKENIILNKDDIILNINNQLLSKQSDIGNLNVKNTLLSQNSSYMTYLDWFLRVVSLYNAFSQPTTQFSDLDRTKMNEIQQLVTSLAARNSSNVFSAADATTGIGTITRG